MIVVRQHRIYRSDLMANRDLLYLFGDNVVRKGMGGQAKEMRGELNAHGIATKHRPGRSYDDYFYDIDFLILKNIVYEDLLALRKRLREEAVYPNGNGYKGIVLPLDGIGTGLAKLPENAPKLLKFINDDLKCIFDMEIK